MRVSFSLLTRPRTLTLTQMETVDFAYVPTPMPPELETNQLTLARSPGWWPPGASDERYAWGWAWAFSARGNRV